MNASLEDHPINIKIKLSALWAGVTLCYLYCDYFELYVPEKVQGMISGENLLHSPTKLFIAAVVLAVPAVMVFLSILLKPIVSKWLNIVVGIVFTCMMVLIAFTYSEVWYTFYLFYAILESLITATIVWYAWKWPESI
ncbi:MAG: DUF6326 family protein [Flammeovirgaceae bacterium]|jgi:hypothetical protein|nr:DUF6326 family protein [Flammeovirgaceae bacterium]